MPRKTSILAIYAPDEIPSRKEWLARHVSDVATDCHAFVDDAMTKAKAIADATPPEGYHVTAMMACPASEPGYAATMAKVSLGTPGRPA